MLGQFNTIDTASVWCLYIPFHKKRNSHSLPTLANSFGGKHCTLLSHDHPGISVPTTHTCSQAHTPDTNTQRYMHVYAPAYTHTHTPSLGFVADSKPALQLLSCISLYHPEKHGLLHKNISHFLISPSLFLPPFSLYLHRLCLRFHFWLIQNNLILPTTPKVHFII